MILAGIDPSFSCSGISVMDTEKKIIRISDVREKIGVKNYQNIFWTSLDVYDGVDKILNCLGEVDYIVSETPYAGGQFSSGLHALDSIIFLNLLYSHKSLQKVFLISSRFLTHVHRKNGIKKYSKSDSTKLVREGIFPILEKYDFDIEYGNKYKEKKDFKGGLNNNTAESFIFLFRLFVNLCRDDEDKREMFDEVYQVAKGLYDGDIEDILVEREDIIERG